MNAPRIVAHRGLHDVEPENSLGAFRCAVRAGCEWIEFDVQASADDVPVILHDPTLDRTTMDTGRADARRAADLASIHHRRENGGLHWSHLTVLNEGARRLPPASYVVEVKPPDANRLVKRLAKFIRSRPSPPFRWVIQSFDPANLAHAKRHAAHIQRHLLVESRRELLAAVESPWDGINAHHAVLDDEIVQALRAHGKMVGAWTVNDADEIRRVIDLKIDLIISDNPVRVREVLLAAQGRLVD